MMIVGVNRDVAEEHHHVLLFGVKRCRKQPQYLG
jgi:hypothetical protein